MKRLPEVAVILSTYNQPRWLEKVLWGYMKQTFRAFDLIIADDGSGEETAEMIRYYQENSALNLYHTWHPDKGFRKCRILNQAILETNADYLIFSDGDCIPRADFVEKHLRSLRKGFFLSGGNIKLNRKVSEAITSQDVDAQRPFNFRWLLKMGQPMSSKLMKLVRNPAIADLLNRITPTRATWNGHNVSGWKADIIKVNGYNEEMMYGGLDRELGERLMNAGVTGRQIRYSAICVHLDHQRPYKQLSVIRKNKAIRREVKKKGLTWTKNGVTGHMPENYP
ncbi:MAG: glycosyltransferase family 2 protein [Bacteroidales bacterium]